MTPDQKQALSLKEQGKPRKEIARIMGKSERAIKGLLERARKWQASDLALTSGATAIGADTPAKVVWTKTHKDGSVTHSVMHTASDDGEIDIVEKVAESFQDVRPYTTQSSPQLNNDLLTVYPLYDMHIGMLAWGRETRDVDYDLGLMKSDLVNSILEVASLSPKSDDALIVLGGDTIHINDHFNETPASGHKMDADGRFEKIMDTAIEAVTNAIELVAERHSRVKVVVLRGNHDETSHIVLKAALKQRYRLSDNITFPVVSTWDKSEIYWFKHGKSLLAFHHGDKAPPERLAMIIADKCPHWSETKYRAILTGHLHSLKVKDMPGCTHYTLRAFCPPDAYGAMYGGVRGLAAMTFSETKGLRVVAHDPIERG